MAEGTSNTISSHKEEIGAKMISKLAKTTAHFKHQQRGEPDLTHKEKSRIAADILGKSSHLFLERFAPYLTLEDIEYFSDQRGDYQIDFYLEDIGKRCSNSSHNAHVIKNRRYRALQELMEEGDYFSEDEMKWRDPLLFEQMIGQFKTETEKEEEMEQEIDKSDLRFSTILLKHMDTQANRQFYEVLKEKEEEQEEEEEDSDEEEEASDMKDESGKRKKKGIADTEPSQEDSEIAQLDRIFMQNEFLRIMQERFLSGEDRNFDYSKVDNNAAYDSLDIVGQDAEEKYFDADDSLDDFSDSEAVNGERMPACDSYISRRLEGMELRSEVDYDGKDRCMGNERSDSAGMDVVEDYMTYVPSEELLKQTQCEA